MLPSRDYIDWLLDVARWLVVDGEITATLDEGAAIVLPTEEDFPVDPTLDGHELAEDYFAFVLEHTRLAEWGFELVPQEPASAAAILAGMPHAMTEAPVPDEHDDEDLRVAADEPLPIPYAPELVEAPDRLLASFALGVAHYYAQTIRTPPPADPEMFGAIVDVTAVFLGFGVLTANASFQARAYESGGLVGFGVSRLGTLGPLEIAYALGLRVELVGADFDEIAPHLATNPRSWARDAISDLRRHHADALERIRRREKPGVGPYRT